MSKNKNEHSDTSPDLNIGVTVKNTSTDRIIDGISSGADHAIKGANSVGNLLKKLILPAILIIVAVSGIGIFVEMKEKSDRIELETFSKNKILGSYRITDFTVNGVSDFISSPVRKAIISDDELVIYIDDNGNGKFEKFEKTVFKLKSIEKHPDPEEYSRGILTTTSGEKISYVIFNREEFGSMTSIIRYSIGQDDYSMWIHN